MFWKLRCRNSWAVSQTSQLMELIGLPSWCFPVGAVQLYPWCCPFHRKFYYLVACPEVDWRWVLWFNNIGGLQGCIWEVWTTWFRHRREGGYRYESTQDIVHMKYEAQRPIKLPWITPAVAILGADMKPSTLAIGFLLDGYDGSRGKIISAIKQGLTQQLTVSLCRSPWAWQND